MTLLAEPLAWEAECFADDGDPTDFRVRCFSGGALIARGELRPGTIFGCVGIWGVFVDEAHRGRGHAREVMTRLIDLGRSRGYRELYLKVETRNAVAIHLYQSLGFIVESRDAGLGTWGTSWDLTIMRLDLA